MTTAFMEKIDINQPTTRPPLLAVTPGEPAGIGPDIILASLGKSLPADLLVVADPELMRQRAIALGLNIDINNWLETHTVSSTALNIVPVQLAHQDNTRTDA